MALPAYPSLCQINTAAWPTGPAAQKSSRINQEWRKDFAVEEILFKRTTENFLINSVFSVASYSNDSYVVIKARQLPVVEISFDYIEETINERSGCGCC
jgi:hypothetical protein